MALGKTSQKVAFWDCLQKLRIQEAEVDEENINISGLNVPIKTKIIKLGIITKPNWCYLEMHRKIKASEIFKVNEGKKYIMKL